MPKDVFTVMVMVSEPSELAAIFTEWDRRYREEPERFQSEAIRLLKGTPKSYGEAAAPYFLQIQRELQEGKRTRKKRKK